MVIVQNKALNYLSANFTEDETAWDSGALYDYAQEIRDGHYIYAYAGTTGTNTSDSPSVDSEKIGKKWVQIRPTNYFAMIDGKTNTQTQNTDTITVTLACTNYDAVSLLGLDATEVVLELYDNITSAVVYTNTISLVNTMDIVDFSTYCFEEFNNAATIYDDSIPLYTDAVLTITIKNLGVTAKCGRLVLGRTYFVADTGAGANLGLESYSGKETDIFGNTELYHSNSVNIDSYEIYVPTSKIPSLRRKIKEIDAVPVLFIMDEHQNSKLEHLLTYGYWENFSIIIPESDISTASITIKGLL